MARTTTTTTTKRQPTRNSSSSPWLKSVLVPFWTIQLLFMCILLGAGIWLARSARRARRGLEALGLVQMLFCAACLILDVTEIILFARSALKPTTYLVFQVVKTTLWFVVFVIVVVVSVRDHGVNNEASVGYFRVGVRVLLSGLIEAVVVLLAFLATLIYASVIHYRHRASKRHHHPLDHNDPFYNGPYSSHGIIEANYDHQAPTQHYRDPHNDNDRRADIENGEEDPCESGGREIHGHVDAQTSDRRMHELVGEGLEVHELATASN